MVTERKKHRREEILQTLASQLEENPGEPIRTASLAKAVGISEAALYRHFPSKAKMFEALIVFSEETIFSRINKIQKEQKSVAVQCEAIVHLLLTFASRNPGIVRILMGEAIVGESEKLRIRVNQLFDRLETQIKQIIREGAMRGQLSKDINAAMLANYVLAYIEGRIIQYQRSGFKVSPLVHADAQWELIADLFKSPVNTS